MPPHASVLGDEPQVPVDFAAADTPAASARPREVLGWHPTGPGLLADIGQPDYYAGA